MSEPLKFTSDADWLRELSRLTAPFGSAQPYEIREKADRLDNIATKLERLEGKLRALRPMVRAARSWHDFHHGSTIVQCDDICEALPAAEEAMNASS